ncbi:MAG: DUF1648 domain-containing protein [Prolixibacteraceae bacterium]|nr:DUF1648 domain-containing protein [Prolixibacteraceae bacterium]
MEKRPRIKIERTSLDKVVDLAGWLVLAGLWLMILLNYADLPETIPTHFDAAGKADDYGSKSTIFMLPVIATILYAGMTRLNLFPHIFNFPTKITTENALGQYTNSTQMMRYVKLVIVFLFTIIVFKTMQTATGKSDGLGIWFLPLVLVLALAPFVVYLLRFYRAK